MIGGPAFSKIADKPEPNQVVSKSNKIKWITTPKKKCKILPHLEEKYQIRPHSLLVLLFTHFAIICYAQQVPCKNQNILRNPTFKCNPLYWSLCVVFCCFGHLQTIFLQYLYLFPQAFEAIASSSGGIQTLIDEDINQDDKISTTESKSETLIMGKVKFVKHTIQIQTKLQIKIHIY